MASTRSKNTPGNFCLEQRENRNSRKLPIAFYDYQSENYQYRRVFNCLRRKCGLCQLFANFPRIDYSFPYHGNQKEIGRNG